MSRISALVAVVLYVGALIFPTPADAGYWWEAGWLIGKIHDRVLVAMPREPTPVAVPKLSEHQAKGCSK